MANNHQPFEDWVLLDQNLSPQDTLALNEHLEACESCRSLSTAWQEVESRLRLEQQVAPPVGFTARWQERLAKDRRRVQRRQTFAVMLFSVGGAVALMILLGVALLPVLQSPRPILLALAYQLTTTVAGFTTTAGVFGKLASTLLGLIPPTLWVGIGTAFGALAVVWIVALRKLTSPWRMMA